MKLWLRKNRRRIALFVACALVFTYLGYSRQHAAETVPYLQFVRELDGRQVKTVFFDLNAPTFVYETRSGKKESTDNPRDAAFKKMLLEKGVEVKEVHAPVLWSGVVSGALEAFFWIALLYIGMEVLNRKFRMAVKPVTNVRVRFQDVAGLKGVKADMEDLLAFLKTPERFRRMGAKLPKGVVFYGPPGTGKTLTAKALAGEAGVPFFSVNGSDFVELYVGLGAKRVRDLFKAARKNAPCVVFIDELDAVGTRRGADSNSERDQTVNAFLSELDGFAGTEGVVVIAATNRLEDLDPALIRPGRFDKRIAFSLPDYSERLEILKTHGQGKKLDPAISLESWAKQTVGFSGADLAALMNEAAVRSVVSGHERIREEDMEAAYFQMVMNGRPRSNDGRAREELELAAWHEAGHAVAAKLLGREVRKVTLLGVGEAGGITLVAPLRLGMVSKEEWLNGIRVLYAGRAGEYLLTGSEEKVTTGAKDDIRQATERMKEYIKEYGFGELGPLALGVFSEDARVLEEASALARRLYSETIRHLEEHRDAVRKVAEVLLERETLNGQEVDELVWSG